MPSSIALITDFGLSGSYSGELKGTILSFCADARIIDITHCIERGAVRSAAVTLATCLTSFPETTVFCAMVDPGVRGKRRALVAHVCNRYIVAPDNGIMSWALRLTTDSVVRQIDYQKLPFDDCLSHGTKIFGVVAAQLALGRNFCEVGPMVEDIVKIPFPETEESATGITTGIIEADSFGNVITAAENRFLCGHSGRAQVLIDGGKTLDVRIADCYEGVLQGELLIYPGSSGFIEIGINCGNAAKLINVHADSSLTVVFTD